MLKNVIKELQEKPLGYLTAICARPGDGRKSFTIELANDLAQQDYTVCYCSITQTKKNLENKLLSDVHILNAFPHGENYVLNRLTESARVSGTVVLVDDLSSFVLQEGLQHAPVGAYDKMKIKSDLLLKIKEIATQRGLRIIVADTFSHASNTDNMLPISKDALCFCDRAYILYKNSITEDTIYNADAGVLKLKEIK